MEPLLQVRDLCVEYAAPGAAPSQALRGASFDIGPGEAVGILGESGCGKSTLALALLGLLPASARVLQGAVHFQGRDLLFLPEREMQRVRGAEMSLVFQDPASALNPVLGVGSQVADVVAAHHHWPRGRCRETAEAMLREVGLSGDGRFYSAYPHELSGGQRQRVVIAQALACRPALLIADEPTSSLDTTVQAEILALLQRLRSELGLAMIFISHNPAVLAEVAERILVIYAGQVVEDGSARDVLGAPLHPYTQALLSCLPRARNGREKMTAIDGNPPDPAFPPPGCAFEPRCRERMEVCSIRMPAEVHPATAHRVCCFKYGG